MSETGTDLTIMFYMQIIIQITGACIGTAFWLLIRHIDSPAWFIMDHIKSRYGKESYLYKTLWENPFVICGVVGLLVSLFPFMGIRFALFSTSGALVIGYILIRLIKKMP